MDNIDKTTNNFVVKEEDAMNIVSNNPDAIELHTENDVMAASPNKENDKISTVYTAFRKDITCY